MTAAEQAWYDDDAGPLVRPYALTGGRTETGRYDLDVITLVVAVEPGAHLHLVGPDHQRVLRACAHPSSVAEVSARLNVPLGVTKILIGDLIESGYLVFRSGVQQDAPDLVMMQKVLDGIRNL
ncbi:DUF742 domain-containing protein [Actinophytocola sp.]|uniref:DUF742 domain-containing protein n=1 Tax=Actinophytocola sp. TaxID=1872138 RepID=UPI002D80ABB0|nr:DUF742 domain-containing protein [Actinophytocola sp.]HET9142368.1 DUF742 domain-containing protein [Actinophytocola sp.]HEU5107339.1 DUF742 domain-containing protein [Micromonosporaceae bacterium]